MAVKESSLIEDVVYGPVTSRRLGASLGINILPAGVKVCGFNCNYCQLGWTYDLVDDAALAKHAWPTAGSVAAGLERRLGELKGTKLDVLTISGNGEPTLHPDLGAVVDAVLRVRDAAAPAVKVAILTNGALLGRPAVVAALNLLDERHVKLDAGNDERFLEMNSPTFEVGVWDVIQGARRLTDCVVQAMFTRGRRDNSSDADVDRWISAVAKINPKAIHIYSIDRPPADVKITAVPADVLSSIAARVTAATGIPARAF